MPDLVEDHRCGHNSTLSTYYIIALSIQCMHGVDASGRARERLQGERLIPSAETGEVVLWRSQMGAVAPRQRPFAGAPARLDRGPRRTVGGPAHATHGRRAQEPRRGLRATMVAAPARQAVRDSRRDGGDADLGACGVQSGPCQQAPPAGGGRHGASDRAPRGAVRAGTTRRDALSREAPAAASQDAAAAVVRAEPPAGPRLVRGESGPEVGLTGRLAGGHGRRLGGCDGAAAP
jgi:hypothetical protein